MRSQAKQALAKACFLCFCFLLCLPHKLCSNSNFLFDCCFLFEKVEWNIGKDNVLLKVKSREVIMDLSTFLGCKHKIVIQICRKLKIVEFIELLNCLRNNIHDFFLFHSQLQAVSFATFFREDCQCFGEKLHLRDKRSITTLFRGTCEQRLRNFHVLRMSLNKLKIILKL